MPSYPPRRRGKSSRVPRRQRRIVVCGPRWEGQSPQMRSRRGPASGAHGSGARASSSCCLVLSSRSPRRAALWPAPAAAGVDDSIAAALQPQALAGSGTGVYVWDLDAALPVYELNAATSLAPASNLKLVTSAAALMDWGADHRFSTELYAPDVPVAAGGVLLRRPLPRGLGDPSLSTRSYQRDVFDMTTASFETFARALKREGVKKVRGRVARRRVLVRQAQDRCRTWKDGLQLECGPLSALSGNQGLDNGNRVSAPATYAAKLMTKALAAPASRSRASRAAARCPTPRRLVKRQYSAALRGILRHMNKESDNFFAEMLLKGLGKDFYGEGSTAAGLQASKAALHALGRRDRHLRHPGRLRAELRRTGSPPRAWSRCSAPCASATTSTTSTTRWRSPARTGRCTTACAARRPPATRTPRRARSTSPSACPGYVTSANDHLVGVLDPHERRRRRRTGHGATDGAGRHRRGARQGLSCPASACWRRRRCSASTPSQPSRRFTALAAASSPSSSHSSTASAAAAVSAGRPRRGSRGTG